MPRIVYVQHSPESDELAREMAPGGFDFVMAG